MLIRLTGRPRPVIAAAVGGAFVDQALRAGTWPALLTGKVTFCSLFSLGPSESRASSQGSETVGPKGRRPDTHHTSFKPLS